jgi:hypothetical protein
VVGLTAVTSLRILGFPAAVPLGAYRGLLPFLAGAFAANAASGAALFVSDATALAANPSFQIKMVSIVIGLAVLWRMFSTVVGPAARAEAVAAPDGTLAFAVSGQAKGLAAAAVLIWWLSVIVSGRLVAYLSQAV